MRAETHERTANFFDSYSTQFNARYGNKQSPLNTIINKVFRSSMRRRFERTLEGCTPIEGKTVLDVGTGPGHYAVALAQRGADKVVGLDFAPGMLEIARGLADQAGVSSRCEFLQGDFMTHPFQSQFDYIILMGLMDYIEKPGPLIERVLELTSGFAFFSFPTAGGPLAWQRQLRYKWKCPLYLYDREELRQLFESLTTRPVTYEQLGRDYFVTVFPG